MVGIYWLIVSINTMVDGWYILVDVSINTMVDGWHILVD